MFITVKQLLKFLFNDTKQIYETRKRKESALYTYSRDKQGEFSTFSRDNREQGNKKFWNFVIFSPQNNGIL